MATSMMAATPVAAQGFSINDEGLSFMEEAAETGDVTLLLNGVLDTMAIGNASTQHAITTGLVGNLQINALTQLPNRWRIKLGYFGQYASDDVSSIELDEGYTDNLA